jgi:hypothetical protein
MTGHLEVISDEDCRVLLEGGRVGRVAITADALPVIAPVNYVVEGNTIIFRTRRDGMLARACNDAVIAFEIDDLATDGNGGWSVNVVGIASLVSDSEHIRFVGPWLVTAAGDERIQFVRMRMGLFHGQRISVDVAGRALH